MSAQGGQGARADWGEALLSQLPQSPESCSLIEEGRRLSTTGIAPRATAPRAADWPLARETES